MRLTSIVALAALSATASVTAAHDSWLLVRPVVAGVGEPVRVVFSTGETFPISEHGTDPARVDRWVIMHGDTVRPVKEFAIEGDELVAPVRPAGEGLWIAAAVLKPRFIEIEGEKFDEYLRSEGATAALEARRKADASSVPGREYYSKAGKAFLCVGASRAECESARSGFERPVGHVLEIIPLTNPFSWQAGDTITVRILRDGKPAKGLRVSSGHEGLPEHTYVEHVVTNEKGEARVTLSQSGLWFLRTHVIDAKRPAVRRGGADAPAANWESFWASMTFQVMPR